MKLLAIGSKVFSFNAAGVAASAILLLAIAKYLGSQGQGYFSLTMTVIMIVAAVINGGLGLAAVPALRRGSVSLGRMLRAQGLWTVLIAILLLAVAVLLPRLGWSVLTDLPFGWTNRTLITIAIAAIAMTVFDIFTYDLQAVGRLVISPAFNFLRVVFNLILVVGIVLTATLDLDLSLGSFAVAQVLAVSALGVFVLRLARDHRQTDAGAGRSISTRGVWSQIGYNLRHGWIGQISVLSFILLMRLDQYLVEYFHDAATVGIYSVAVLIGEMLLYLPRALYPLLVHSSASAENAGERDCEAARAVRVGVAVTSVAAVPVFFVAIPLLPFLVGGDYQASGPALRALLPGIIAMAPAHILAGDFVGRGHPGWNAQASLLTVISNITCGLLLIPSHGAVGASLASSIAYFVGAFLMVRRFRRETGISVSDIIRPRLSDFRR